MSESLEVAVVSPPVDDYVPTEYVGQLQPNKYCRAWNSKRLKYCRAVAGMGTDHLGVGRCKYHRGNPSRLTHGLTSRYSHERLGPLLEQFAKESPQERRSIDPELDLARALLADWLNRFETYAEALLRWDRTAEEIHVTADQAGTILRFLNRLDISASTPEELAQLQRSRLLLELLQRPVANPRPRRVMDITTLMKLLDSISRLVERSQRAASFNAVPRIRVLALVDAIGKIVNEVVQDPAQVGAIRERIYALRL